MQLLDREATAVAEPLPPDSLATRVAGAQQRAGNREVSRILARDPNPDLKKGPAEQPPKKKLGTAAEVDVIFNTSAFMKDAAGKKLGKVSMEKVMKLDNAKAFEEAWIEYAKRSINPSTGKLFADDAEARTFMKIKGVRAFQDSDRNLVHILKERADLGTQLHEGLHFFSDDRWKAKTNYHANEGVTEFFTRELGAEVGVERDDSSFLQQYTSAKLLVDAAGKDLVKAAYFDGDIAGLKQKLDARGAGTWKKWLQHLEAAEFKLANALLAAP